MSSSKVALAIRGLSKSFGEIKAVDNLSLEIQPGEIVGFLGPNGAGKTTTFSMISKLSKPSMGSVSIFGKDVWGDYKHSLTDVGVMFENPAFYKNLSAVLNLQIFGRIKNICDKNQISEVLKTVGLYDRQNSKVATFSQGMRQRLGLALAMLGNPKLLLLDEPMNGLDPESTRDMLNLLREKASKCGVTILLSSHMLHEVEEYCDRFFLINHGKLIASGSVEKILKSYNNTIEIYFEGDSPSSETLMEISGISNISKISKNAFELTLENTSPSSINKYLVERDFKVSTIMQKKISLEEYFFAMTGENNNE